MPLLALSVISGPDIPIVPRALLREKDALILDDPEVISVGRVEELRWHPGSGFLMVYRMVDQELSVPKQLRRGSLGYKPQAAGYLNIYATSSKRTTTPIKIPPAGRLLDFKWIPGSSKGLASVFSLDPGPDGEVRGTSSLMWVSAGGDSKKVFVGDEDSYDVLVSPIKPIVAVVSTDSESDPTVRFLDGEGRVTSTSQIPGADEFRWGADGVSLYGGSHRVEKKKLVVDWFRIPKGAGKIEKLTQKPKFFGESKPLSGLTTEIAKVASPDKREIEATVGLIKHPDSGNSLVVSSDCNLVEVAPDASVVAYVHQGIALVRPIVKVPKETYLAMQDAAAKQKAILNAKQSAIAMMLYAADYDDKFVSSSDNWKALLEPYVKDKSVMNDFVLVFPGGSTAAIEDIAGTVLGYIEGPGGRAVAYTDGHVVWVPTP